MLLLHAAQASVTTTTSPWWGVPAVAGAFALGGALITVLLNYVQGRRQHNARWEKELRELSREFLTLARADLRSVLDSERGNPRETREAREAHNALVASYSELSLLAPQAVVDSAWRVLETLRDLGSSYRTSDTPNAVVHERWKSHLQAKRTFTNTVRVALGLAHVEQSLDERALDGIGANPS